MKALLGFAFCHQSSIHTRTHFEHDFELSQTVTAEETVLWGLKELGYCTLTREFLSREGLPEAVAVALGIATKYRLRCKIGSFGQETVFRFTRERKGVIRKNLVLIQPK
jgi:hypothetical protein